jgi:c-di-GMP-binding flagellar brake protein YcgR
MENRRQTYRQSFPSQEVLRAELYRPGQRSVLPCEVLDLSLGGMHVRLRERIDSLSIDDFLVTRLLGRDAPAPINLSLSLPSQVVSLKQSGEEWHCGLRFLPIADPRANDNIERSLSRFLLCEQRRRNEANRQR